MSLTEIITISFPIWGWIIVGMFEWTGLGFFLLGIYLMIKKLIKAENQGRIRK